MRHYFVELREAKQPLGITTSAIRGCMCCGSVLSGMGGGGDFLCQDCLDKMRTGEMAEAIYLLHRQREHSDGG